AFAVAVAFVFASLIRTERCAATAFVLAGVNATVSVPEIAFFRRSFLLAAVVFSVSETVPARFAVLVPVATVRPPLFTATRNVPAAGALTDTFVPTTRSEVSERLRVLDDGAPVAPVEPLAPGAPGAPAGPWAPGAPGAPA